MLWNIKRENLFRKRESQTFSKGHSCSLISFFRKLPLSATPEHAKQILPMIAGFVERQWIVPRVEDLEIIDEILELNNMSVKNAIDNLGTVCKDFLLVCSFAGTMFPCMQV
jgi:acid-sensing ion channel, other